jgi:hypothetical protein
MNKILASIIAVVIVFSIALSAATLSQAPFQGTPKELDFTVSGSNDCLRFLNSTVSTVYVPIVTGASENWQLTINATKMPGGANGWTDVYIYRGYWNKGTNNTCLSEDLYLILSDIKSADAQIRGDTPYTASFGGPKPQSYTVFFIFPPGGKATFHVTLSAR